MQIVRRPASLFAPALIGLRLAIGDRRFVGVSVLGTLGVAALIGIPTDVLANPWYTRMTAITPEQYVWWAAISLLSGMLLATYVSAGGRSARGSGFASGFLGYLAIGCPICNKLIVALLGVSGALSYFAPLQPLLGAMAVLLAGFGLLIRFAALAEGCPLPAVGSGAAP